LLTVVATLTALVGVLLLLATVLRLGFVANFISTPCCGLQWASAS
jgi:MFS superfamily sulfate permease-like transporter